MFRLGILSLALSAALLGCGRDSFDERERSEVRQACLARYAAGAENLERFCACSVQALENADASDLRDDKDAFLEEHLTERTIERCS